MADVDGFRHEAFLYADDAEFLAGTAAFIRDAVEADEPILVVVDAHKIDVLCDTLGSSTGQAQFADMAEVGRNPAQIIPAWRSFVDQHATSGRPLRGIGEPIWPGRSPLQLVECRQHEALLNLAFGDTPGFWLMCPYDTSGLDPAVIEQAQGTHPLIRQDHHDYPSHRYAGVDAAELLQESLPAAPSTATTCAFGLDLAAVRRFAASHAATLGLTPVKAVDLMLVVGELTTNSIRHGAGRGTLRLWRDGRTLTCEVHDWGRVTDPLLGRRRPARGQSHGLGLWVVNQVCDLLQIRSTPTAGTTIRAHLALA